MLLVSVLNLFSLPTMSFYKYKRITFPYKSLRFSSNTFHLKSENEQNYTSRHYNSPSISQKSECKIILNHFITQAFISPKPE